MRLTEEDLRHMICEEILREEEDGEDIRSYVQAQIGRWDFIDTIMRATAAAVHGKFPSASHQEVTSAILVGMAAPIRRAVETKVGGGGTVAQKPPNHLQGSRKQAAPNRDVDESRKIRKRTRS